MGFDSYKYNPGMIGRKFSGMRDGGGSLFPIEVILSQIILLRCFPQSSEIQMFAPHDTYAPTVFVPILLELEFPAGWQ